MELLLPLWLPILLSAALDRRQEDRNGRRAAIDSRFTTADARIKLRTPYTEMNE